MASRRSVHSSAEGGRNLVCETGNSLTSIGSMPFAGKQRRQLRADLIERPFSARFERPQRRTRAARSNAFTPAGTELNR